MKDKLRSMNDVGVEEAKERLLFLKILHTAVWVVLVSMIFYILYSGISNRIGLFTYVSMGAVILEGIVLLIFRWKCPITIAASKYGDENETGFDIFLPKFIAKHNKTIFTSLYLIGILIVILRKI